MFAAYSSALVATSPCACGAIRAPRCTRTCHQAHIFQCAPHTSMRPAQPRPTLLRGSKMIGDLKRDLADLADGAFGVNALVASGMWASAMAPNGQRYETLCSFGIRPEGGRIETFDMPNEACDAFLAPLEEYVKGGLLIIRRTPPELDYQEPNDLFEPGRWVRGGYFVRSRLVVLRG